MKREAFLPALAREERLNERLPVARQLIDPELAALMGADDAGLAQERKLMRDAALRRGGVGRPRDHLYEIADADLGACADQVREPEALAVAEGLSARRRRIQMNPARTAPDEG